MTRPPDVARIVLSGQLPGGEIWSTGFWMTDTGVHDNATAAAQAEVCGGTLNADDSSGAMRISIANLFATGMNWLQTACYFYAGGSNTATYSGIWTLPEPRVGTNLGHHPNQVAGVLSLRTNFAGRSNRGRMYLPAAGIVLDGTGQYNPANCQTLTDAWGLAFSDINASDAGKVVVVSDVASTAHQVSLVKFNSRMDIQRSRANRQTINGAGQTVVTL